MCIRDSGGNRRIDLHKNFRSRAEVLDAVNFIFRQIMTEELGRITYDENAALYVGASYPESEKNETEILLLDTKSEEEDTGLSVRSGSQTAKELEVDVYKRQEISSRADRMSRSDPGRKEIWQGRIIWHFMK